MDYIFTFSVAQGIFALPCDAVDLYINEASPDDLKLLLFVYRHGGKTLSEDSLCRSLGLSAEALRTSLAFWSAKKLLSVTVSGEQPQAVPALSEPPAPAKPKRVVEQAPHYGADEETKLLTANADLKFLLDASAGLFGRLLSENDCSTLIYLYDGLGLPADVILMLVEYCVSAGHANMRYIEKAAMSWSEDGINSHELAEHKICELEEHRSFEGKIRTTMGITGRSLTQTERQHISRWSQWNTPVELISLAYEICVKRTGKLSFSYINSILAAWHEKGYTTPDQAKNENQPQSGKRASYNIDEYVDLSMKRLLNE